MIIYEQVGYHWSFVASEQICYHFPIGAYAKLFPAVVVIMDVQSTQK